MKKYALGLMLLLSTEVKSQIFTQISTGTTQQLLSVYMANNAVGFVTGDHGVFKKTTDGGLNWSSNIAVGTSQALWQTTAPDSDTSGNTLFIVGDIPDVIKSTDAGATFYHLSTGLPSNSYLLGIDCLDTHHIFACGSSPAGACIVRSDNGGISWQTTIIAGLLSFIKVHFADTLHGYAAATGDFMNGSIYKTTDGGKTWLQVKSSNYLITNILCLTADTCIAVGTHGQIWQTTDGGINWLNRSVDTIDIFGLTRADNSTLYAAGGTNVNSSFVYQSTDNGQTWVAKHTGYNNRITDISVPPHSSIAVCSGQAGKVLRAILPTSVLHPIFLKQNFSIWPNPTTDFIHVINCDDFSYYSVLDSYGRKIQEGVSVGIIDVRSFVPGRYVLILKNKAQNIVHSEFIVNK
jgi:photosystem II stability/assembly factor-like uncharacterized protein